MRLTWVQPDDLVGHALARAAYDGVDATAVRERWQAAGGDPEPLHAGASDRPPSAALRALAGEILDELDELDRRQPGLEAREPTELAAIRRSTSAPPSARADSASPYARWGSTAGRTAGPGLYDRTHGGWLGRAAGCLLGKPVEKIPRQGIRQILESTGRWPLDTWFTGRGLPDEVARRWPWNRRSAPTSLAENIDGMPVDDDLEFALLALGLLERHGDALTTSDVAAAWLAELPAGRVFTAERVAYRNLLLGLEPPRTATYRNPFQDWIGAQIRADVYGWAFPGDPARAAEFAWRDAVLSHTRCGVHGAMFVAAACSAALVAGSIDEVLDAALSVVPASSRYAEAVALARESARAEDFETVVDAIEERYGSLHWVHVLPNAALCVAALVHSGGDFDRSITRVVSAGRDTDSNGATVGSIAGALTGAGGLPTRWVEPLRNRLASALNGFDGIGFDVLAGRTVAVAEALAGTQSEQSERSG